MEDRLEKNDEMSIENISVEENIDKNNNDSSPKKASINKGKIIAVFASAVILIFVAIYIATLFINKSKDDELTGENLAAYELICDVSYEFKDPTSVRILAGKVIYDEEDAHWSGWFTISAINGLGVKSTGYYFVGYTDGEVFALDLEEYGDDYSLKLAKSNDLLDIDKINKELTKKWENI